MINRSLLAFALCLLSISLYSKEYDSEILFHNTYVWVSASSLTRVDTIAIMVNTRLGDPDAEISLAYNRKENLAVTDGWIEDRSGKIVRRLRQSDISTTSLLSGSSFYDDEYVKSFSLKHNTYPYKVVFVYKHSCTDFLSIVAWEPEDMEIPVRSRRITVEAPAGYTVHHKEVNTSGPEVFNMGKTLKMIWKSEYSPVDLQQDAAVSWLGYPAIYIAPRDFHYGEKGDYSSWGSFGDWLSRLNAKTGDLPKSEKERVARLVEGVASPREKAAILYRDLQQRTRYINVSVDKGGLKSYPASYVSANRYGDCKALCTYMQSALASVGVKSYYTLVEAGGTIPDFDPAFPFQVFNHVILTVPIDRDTIFLECTDNNAAFGYTGTFTQGRRGLIADGPASRLISIPALSEEEVLCSRRIETTLAEGNETFSLNMECRGLDYELYTALAAGINRNQAEQYIRTRLMRRFELLETSLTPPAGEEAVVCFTAQGKLHNLQRKYGENVFVSLFPLDIPVYERPEVRTQGVSFDYPRCQQDTITYRFTQEMKITRVPDNIEIDSRFGRYSLRYLLHGDRMVVHKELVVRRGEYPLEDYADFYTFISAVRNAENMNLKIE